jgi:hypothetical protein
MVFANAINSSNNDFELLTGANQLANRDRLLGGYTENIGITYSAGTFTVRAGDGNALSSTNPGYVNIQSKVTPGKQIKIAITANQTFTDGAAGGTDNMRWGLSTGVNASVDMPFFLYAVVDDTDTSIAFMFSRIPHAFISPISTRIGKSGAVVNVGQGDFFSLANITVTSYDANPCLCIGSFRMQFVGATDSWTVQTITNQDGVGMFQDGIGFLFPRGQFGAAAGKYYADNGGTAPDDSSGSYVYIIGKNGHCFLFLAFPSITTAGAASVQTKLAIPFTAGIGSFIITGVQIGSGVYSNYLSDIAAASTLTNSTIYINSVGSGLYTNDIFTVGSTLIFQGSYYITR